MQVVDERIQVDHLIMQRIEGIGIKWTHTVLYCFEFALQYRKRRAQLVGYIGNPLLARAAVLFKRERESVEIFGKLADLIAAAHLDARVVIAACQCTCAGYHFPDGTRKKGRGRKRDQRRYENQPK